MSYGLEHRQTIFALATPPGKGAIAVIRISGRNTAKAIAALAGRLPPPRMASLRKIHHPDSGCILDHCLVIWTPGPKSFTGEDCAELHLHGAKAVVAAVLQALKFFPDLRMAAPGEFAHRALSNGKMNLIDIEALGDLMQAETEQQRRFAIMQMRGDLNALAERWRQQLIENLMLVESELDFADEADAPSHNRPRIGQNCAKMIDAIEPLIDQGRVAERLREGLTVLIAGPPNAGKSTLLNAIARRDVAIVSERAGTTRDLIEVHLDLDGYPVTLVDTAGIRPSDDPVEQIGIARAIKRSQAADLVLWLSPRDHRGVSPPDSMSGGALWRIGTKADKAAGPLGAEADENETLQISAETGQNIPELIARLQRFASAELAAESSIIVANERQRSALQVARDALLAALDEATPLEFLAEDLRRACLALESLTGKIGVEDVLDQLFSRFCIGK